jgi:hypothetical protein
MKVSKLTDEELLAFVALLKLVVRADHGLSAGEAAELRRAAAEMGEAAWYVMANEAEERLHDESQIQQYAATIKRGRARRLIFDRLVDAARHGTIVEEEAAILRWLADLWGLALPPELRDTAD